MTGGQVNANNLLRHYIFYRVLLLSLCKSFQIKSTIVQMTYEPRHEKTCLRGLRPVKTQTGLLSWWDELGSWNFGYSKQRYYTVQAVNNKGADQTARMHRLICTFVVRIWHKQVFSWRGSYLRDIWDISLEWIVPRLLSFNRWNVQVFCTDVNFKHCYDSTYSCTEHCM